MFKFVVVWLVLLTSGCSAHYISTPIVVCILSTPCGGVP